MVGSRFMPGLFFIRERADPAFAGSPGFQNSQLAELDFRGPFSSSGWLADRHFMLLVRIKYLPGQASGSETGN